MQTVDAGPTTTSQYHEPPYPPSPAESGFPSPASEGLSARALFKLDTTSSLSDPTASAPTDTIPQTPVAASLITDTPTPTPPHETLPDIQMPAIIAAAIPLTTPPIAKATRSNLRLPPFDLLGIAVSRPDRISMGNQQATPFIGAGPPSQPEDPLHLCKSPFGNETRPSFTSTSPYPSKLPSSSASPQILGQVPPSHKSIQQYILTQTPPDDNGKIDWSAMRTTQAAPLASPEQGGTSISHPSSSAGPSSSNDDSSTRPTSVGTPSFPGSLRAAGPRNSPWLRDVVPLILNNVDAAGGSSGHVTVMSHALPLPSVHGHVFPSIINSIHERILPRSTVWINVFHAVPGSINLADLPTSPPTTPALPNEGDDYFTTKVFDSAVAVPDYQGEGQITSPSPRPVVVPSSVDVTVVERYIPPTSEREFSELFFSSGRSILSDRLVELSSSNGTLVFIYPTRRGGQTFMKDYLSPVLEPILRAMMVGDNLPYSLINELGYMPAVNELSTFEDMRARFEDFCQQLSTSQSTPLDRFHHTPATYSVIHASKQEVTLIKDVWAKDWWNRQEKPRVRNLIKEYNKRLRRSGDDDTPPFQGTELVERLLERVATGRRSIRTDTGVGSAVTTPATEHLRTPSRDVEHHATPMSPIEVAVFIVQKTAMGQGSKA